MTGNLKCLQIFCFVSAPPLICIYRCEWSSSDYSPTTKSNSSICLFWRELLTYVCFRHGFKFWSVSAKISGIYRSGERPVLDQGKTDDKLSPASNKVSISAGCFKRSFQCERKLHLKLLAQAKEHWVFAQALRRPSIPNGFVRFCSGTAGIYLSDHRLIVPVRPDFRTLVLDMSNDINLQITLRSCFLDLHNPNINFVLISFGHCVSKLSNQWFYALYCMYCWRDQVLHRGFLHLPCHQGCPWVMA